MKRKLSRKHSAVVQRRRRALFEQRCIEAGWPSSSALITAINAGAVLLPAPLIMNEDENNGTENGKH